MRCPYCRSGEVRVAECFELVYEVDGSGEPGRLLNGNEVFAGPEEYYYLCADCLSRWNESGHALQPVFTVPDLA